MPKVYDILNAGSRNKFMVRSKKTKQVAVVHNCYLTGWKKLHHTARLWGNPITVELAQLAHAMYRRSHPPVVDMWDVLEEVMFMLADGGKFSQVLNPVYVDDAGLHLPNGFLIQYPGIRYDRKSRRFTYYNAARRCVVNVHKGLVMENCIAAGSEVLTETRGWVAIETLQPDERVWNGDCWCSHKGLLYNNMQATIDVEGVCMTPDHLVMTDSGWEKAENVGNKGVLYAERKVY